MRHLSYRQCPVAQKLCINNGKPYWYVLGTLREVVKYLPLQRIEIIGLADLGDPRVSQSVVAFRGHDPIVLSTW